jgi:hypothetical protein
MGKTLHSWEFVSLNDFKTAYFKELQSIFEENKKYAHGFEKATLEFVDDDGNKSFKINRPVYFIALLGTIYTLMQMLVRLRYGRWFLYYMAPTLPIASATIVHIHSISSFVLWLLCYFQVFANNSNYHKTIGKFVFFLWFAICLPTGLYLTWNALSTHDYIILNAFVSINFMETLWAVSYMFIKGAFIFKRKDIPLAKKILGHKTYMIKAMTVSHIIIYPRIFFAVMKLFVPISNIQLVYGMANGIFTLPLLLWLTITQTKKNFINFLLILIRWTIWMFLPIMISK